MSKDMRSNCIKILFYFSIKLNEEFLSVWKPKVLSVHSYRSWLVDWVRATRSPLVSINLSGWTTKSMQHCELGNQSPRPKSFPQDYNLYLSSDFIFAAINSITWAMRTPMVAALHEILTFYLRSASSTSPNITIIHSILSHLKGLK